MEVLFVETDYLRRHLLNEDQAEDLKVLVMHLPMLLKSLKSAGLVPSEPKKKQPAVNGGVNPEIDVGATKEKAKRDVKIATDGVIDENYTAKMDVAAVSTPEKGIWSVPLKETRTAIVEPLTPLPNGQSEDPHTPSNPDLEYRQVIHPRSSNSSTS